MWLRVGGLGGLAGGEGCRVGCWRKIPCRGSSCTLMRHGLHLQGAMLRMRRPKRLDPCGLGDLTQISVL